MQLSIKRFDWAIGECDYTMEDARCSVPRDAGRR